MHRLLFVLGLARAPLEGGPALAPPPDTLFIREVYAPGPGDRTGNWRARIDERGCWSVAHNTWLRVTDPVLARQPDLLLHFNGEFSTPWFCLDAPQQARLRQAIGQAGFERSRRAAPVIERWSARAGDRWVSATFPVGQPPRGLAPLVDVLEQLAGEHAWAGSEEIADEEWLEPE